MVWTCGASPHTTRHTRCHPLPPPQTCTGSLPICPHLLLTHASSSRLPTSVLGCCCCAADGSLPNTVHSPWLGFPMSPLFWIHNLLPVVPTHACGCCSYCPFPGLNIAWRGVCPTACYPISGARFEFACPASTRSLGVWARGLAPPSCLTAPYFLHTRHSYGTTTAAPQLHTITCTPHHLPLYLLPHIPAAPLPENLDMIGRRLPTRLLLLPTTQHLPPTRPLPTWTAALKERPPHPGLVVAHTTAPCRALIVRTYHTGHRNGAVDTIMLTAPHCRAGNTGCRPLPPDMHAEYGTWRKTVKDRQCRRFTPTQLCRHRFPVRIERFMPFGSPPWAWRFCHTARGRLPGLWCRWADSITSTPALFTTCAWRFFLHSAPIITVNIAWFSLVLTCLPRFCTAPPGYVF